MAKQMQPGEADRQFHEAAKEIWEEVSLWMEEHPEATLKEIEQFLRPRRRRLMATIVALQILKRRAVDAEGPCCPQCGRPMEYKGLREKMTVGLELEGPLPLDYYHCPHCGEGFSPPEGAIAGGESALE